VLEVAAVAGIDARHWLSSIVAVPERLVRTQEPIMHEWRMWQRRQASRGEFNGPRQGAQWSAATSCC
jgi:hypothetical protein